MPALKNTRHEAMANALAIGTPQGEAYRKAGFTGQSNSVAAQMANRADIKARVQEIIATQYQREARSNERAIERASIDKEWIVARAKYIVEFGIRGRPLLDDKGHDTGKFAVKPNLDAAGKSLTLLARMGGYLIERIEHGAPGDFARLTDEELDLKLIEVGEAIGISGPELQRVIGPLVKQE